MNVLGDKSFLGVASGGVARKVKLRDMLISAKQHTTLKRPIITLTQMSASAFEERIYYNGQLGLSLVFLL